MLHGSGDDDDVQLEHIASGMMSVGARPSAEYLPPFSGVELCSIRGRPELTVELLFLGLFFRHYSIGSYA